MLLCFVVVSLLKEAVSLLRDQPQSLKRLLLLHQQLILRYAQIVSILDLVMSLVIVNQRVSWEFGIYQDAADEEDDDDVDLFGEETEEEKKAAEERAASVKASTKKKECKFDVLSLHLLITYADMSCVLTGLYFFFISWKVISFD